ncbi:MAG: hypothetical protein P0Y65_03895 [Candidatus Devosia phytovorans]|uniref:Uncharacterized protein n=1 Tax=Candidatus Devosia phytovorans TaxID=3121372 RepID=A0AAJ6B1J1_9HYPH|nr:hypothetical protein [Devosia sp.]WEK05409.1 MAG: hypothetical protein P0Y65_03895 [Devosia sp.]
MKCVAATLIWGAMVMAVSAAPGQCTVTGYGTFECDVALDGQGLTFGLPDGGLFAFALTGEDEGAAYLAGADTAPGALPEELRGLVAVDGKPGCWARDDEFEFCVLVEE